MLRSILVPLDGSQLAERALAYATALSIPTGAGLILVRAVSAHTLAGIDARQAQTDAVNEAEAYLEDVAGGLAMRGFVCQWATPYGSAVEWIPEEARLRGADLIVMTSHGRTGPGRWLLGSVAESVVAHSSVPVLVEQAWHPVVRELLLSDHPRLVVPLDGSTFSEAAVEPAARLAEDLDAELILVHVEPPPPSGLHEQSAYLSGIADQITSRWPDVLVRTEITFGKPADAIARQATDTAAALIVMATHGRTGAERAMRGSVAGRVLEHGTTPVVLIHFVSSA
jgi:nucleotide-binding universal stress UspA family protein